MQDKRCHDLQRAMYFISFSTNLFATSFIIAKAWQHRGAFEVRRSSLTGSGRPRRTTAQKVMLLLIESGFVYLIMGAASGFTYFLGAQDLSSPGYFVTTVFISLRYQIVGLYPTIVIYLVQREQTNGTYLRPDYRISYFPPYRVRRAASGGGRPDSSKTGDLDTDLITQLLAESRRGKLREGSAAPIATSCRQSYAEELFGPTGISSLSLANLAHINQCVIEPARNRISGIAWNRGSANDQVRGKDLKTTKDAGIDGFASNIGVDDFVNTQL
ncbi:hypothetical protein FB107DRAFT_276518 [Schizophyllum commune]